MQAVNEIARRSEAWRCHQDAFVIFDAVLAALYIEVIDDVSISDEGKVELVGGVCRPRLLSPELPGEQTSERRTSQSGEFSSIQHGYLSEWPHELEDDLSSELQDA